MQVLDKTRVETLSQALGEPAWVLAKRLKALEAFHHLPYPTKKDEAWRYTDLSQAPLEQEVEAPRGLRLSRDELPELVRRRLEKTDVSGFLVFVGPDLVYAEVPEELLAKGLVFTSLAEALKRHPNKVENALFQGVFTEDKFAAQNAAFFTHGAFLYVPAGLEVEKPLGVFKVLLEGEKASAGRSLLFLEDNAKAAYIEEYLSPDLSPYPPPLRHGDGPEARGPPAPRPRPDLRGGGVALPPAKGPPGAGCRPQRPGGEPGGALRPERGGLGAPGRRARKARCWASTSATGSSTLTTTPCSTTWSTTPARTSSTRGR